MHFLFPPVTIIIFSEVCKNLELKKTGGENYEMFTQLFLIYYEKNYIILRIYNC